MKNHSLSLRFEIPLLTLILICGCLTAAAQTTDEQILRQLIKQESAGKTTIKFNGNAVFATDALSRPRLLQKVNEIDGVRMQTISAPRPNQILTIEIRRIVVAESKDLAYEYSDFTISYDQPDKTPDGYTGSHLRVWRKTQGEWRVDAVFARQNQPEREREQPKNKIAIRKQEK